LTGKREGEREREGEKERKKLEVDSPKIHPIARFPFLSQPTPTSQIRTPPHNNNNTSAHPIAPSAAADALRSVSGTSSKLPGAAGAGAGAGGGGGTSASGKKGSAHKKGSAAANAAAAAAAVAKIRGRKRKKGEAVTWQLRPFENAARGDVEGGKPLKLTHWVKCLFPAKLLAPPHGTPADDFDFDAAAKQARANAE